jgi:nicotinamidase-related amidase
VNLARAAILSIDLQNEYREAGTYPVVGYDLVLGNATRLINAARQARVPVIHCQAWLEKQDRPAYARMEECLTDEIRPAVAGSRGAEICQEVAPAGDEIVVRKKWPSAFEGTGLHDMLTRRGIEELVVTGVVTDSCVQGSVYDAVYKGYHVWLVKDACGSLSRMMHRTATLDIANRLYGGGVLTTEEAAKALAGEPYRAWRCTRPVEFLYEADTLDRFYDAL